MNRKLNLTLFMLLFTIFAPFGVKAQNRDLVQYDDDKKSQKRIALVIGNGEYQAAKPLANPANDATDMAAILRELGFEVISGVNQNKRQMEGLIREFGTKLAANGGTGLFYYAGHGIQVNSENYLVPIEANIPEEDEIAYSAVPLSLVLTKMTTAKNDLNIVILDACRNNPFALSWRSFRDGGNNSGLAKISPPTGTLVLYATEPGKVASDGSGRNGLFTEALLKNIKQPNLEYDQMVRRLSTEVWEKSNKQQLPWKEGNSLSAFYFATNAINPNPPGKTESAKVETLTERDRSAVERDGWSLIKNSNNSQDFRDFLKEFPNGANSANAKIKLEQTVWDSIKDSQEKAKLQDYLKEFEDGPNAPLVRIKLRQLESRAAAENPETKLNPEPDSETTSNILPPTRTTTDSTSTETTSTLITPPKNDTTTNETTYSELKPNVRANPKPTPNTPTNSEPISNTMTATRGMIRKSSLGMELVYISPGDFTMGSGDAEIDEAVIERKKYFGGAKPEDFADEKPQRKVSIKEAFWMGKFEVTQAEWVAVMGDNPSSFKDCGTNCPVEQVSWEDIQIFLKKLNEKDLQFEYRLPSEAEWEYAARGGTTTVFSFGNSLNSSQANFNGEEPYASTKEKYADKTVAVGTYQPNNFGLYDMHGNVWEWVQDIYNFGYKDLPSDGSVNTNIGDVNLRVLRGGSWDESGVSCRVALRNWFAPAIRSDDLGFRVVARLK
jgi:formylglycine-generating enzyme required for sulfatase activity